MSGQAHFTTTLPTKRIAADCLFRDGVGRVLLLQPTYKPTWDLPGGGGEADESPREAARREVGEELGLCVSPGALLAVDWIQRSGEFTEVVAFLFDGGVLSKSDIERTVLDPSEAQTCRFVSLVEAESMLDGSQLSRLLAAIAAEQTGSTVYLENGRPV